MNSTRMRFTDYDRYVRIRQGRLRIACPFYPEYGQETGKGG